MSKYNHFQMDQWDTSRNKQRYKECELKYIYGMTDKGYSEEFIARKLERQKWAIHVMIMNRYKIRNKQKNRILKANNGKKYTKNTNYKLRCINNFNSNQKTNQISRYYKKVGKNTYRGRSLSQIKREYNAERREIVETSSIEFDDYRKTLMGL